MKRAFRHLLLAMVTFPWTILSRRGYLQQMGWFKTLLTGSSVARDGTPVPWWSYSFFLLIQDRLKPQMSVYEYGSGNSTSWMARKVRSILATETH